MTLALRDPAAESCTNPNVDNRWTCPGCFEDLPITIPGLHTCPNCDHSVECSRQSFISCVADLVETEDV